jgi:hypothetical protein
MSLAPSPVEAPAAPTLAPDPVVDRALWERLRRAAQRGHLQPEGFALLDQLHALYPDWRAQW